MTHVLFPVKYDKVHYKTGRSKRQKCNDRNFVIICFFRNLIMLQMFLKVVIYQIVAFTHSNIPKRYNKANTKSCHLPGNGPLTTPITDIINPRLNGN